MVVEAAVGITHRVIITDEGVQAVGSLLSFEFHTVDSVSGEVDVVKFSMDPFGFAPLVEEAARLVAYLFEPHPGD